MAGKKSRERVFWDRFQRNIIFIATILFVSLFVRRFFRTILQKFAVQFSTRKPPPLRWKLSRVHPSTTRERDEDEDDSSLSLPLPSSPALSLSFPAGGKFGESRKRATLNGANRRCRAAKGCRLKGKQFSWKQLTADWRERRRGSGREGGGSRGRDIWRSMHASLPRESEVTSVRRWK